MPQCRAVLRVSGSEFAALYKNLRLRGGSAGLPLSAVKFPDYSPIFVATTDGATMDIPRDELHSPGRPIEAKHVSRDRPSRGPLSAARLEQIRERLRERAYDSRAVREATARGILRSGDLEQDGPRR